MSTRINRRLKALEQALALWQARVRATEEDCAQCQRAGAALHTRVGKLEAGNAAPIPIAPSYTVTINNAQGSQSHQHIGDGS